MKTVSKGSGYIIILVPEARKGHIIGKKGCTIQRIQAESGAMVHARIGRNMVRLSGSKQQICSAENMIQSILSDSGFKEGSLVVNVPEFTMGFIIGKNRRSLNDIERETGTQIFQDLEDRQPRFYVKGNSIEQYKAKLKIKESACNCRRMQGFKRYITFPFIYDQHVGDDSEFQLKCLDENPHPRWVGFHYELVSVTECQTEGRDSEDFDDLCEKILDILQNLQIRDDGDNLLVDMWCHYGHAYITAVDESEVHEIYSIQQIKNHLKQEDNPWLASFIGGIQQLEVEKIKQHLNEKVPPYVRCDLAFFSPTCRQIRLKVFLRVNESGEELSFCDFEPVVVKNVLEKVSRDNGPVYYLCAPPVQHIKVHIFIPFVDLDCHFMMRTTFKKIIRTPEEEAEDKVLIDFLNENLKINNGNLELPMEPEKLPEGFDLAYWRRSKRRIYSESSEGFTIKISEETLENVTGLQTGEDIRTRNDIHIHCDDWDKKFAEAKWQPNEIVDGVKKFLSFVKEVQNFLSAQEPGEDE